jgi:hypothetical protein
MAEGLLMAEPNGNGAPPVANRPVVQGELKRALASRHRNPGSSVLLLRAAPQWRGDTEFAIDVEGSQLLVTVAPCPTVLAVLDAMAAQRAAGRYLVVLTHREPHEVGDSVLARAMLPEIKPINRWDLVRDAFGARALDENLVRRDNRWVAEALLDAQPAGGWRRLPGPVLSLATALNRLAAVRLGIDAADDTAVDGAALLQWTDDPTAVASFLQLREAERNGLIGWLTQTTGGVAELVFAMAETGKIPDAIPVALAVGALYGQPEHGPELARVSAEALNSRVRADERYFGGHRPADASLRAFWEASESLVIRWAGNGHAAQAAGFCERAEAILAELGAPEVARDSRVLQAGLDARFAALAAALKDFVSGPPPGNRASFPAPAGRLKVFPGAPGTAEQALRQILDHAARRDRAPEIGAAEAAVRVVRWLALPEDEPATPADAATRALRSWAWADRALTILDRTDTSHVPELADACAALLRAGRERRARLDEAFDRKLAAWTASETPAEGLLLVQDILDQIARPVAAQRPPVIVVLDGMSAATASVLAEGLLADGRWLEAGRLADGREPALGVVPSTTLIPVMTLVAGKPGSGGQAEERARFTAFWGRRPSALFYEADLAPEPNRLVADLVRDAILDPGTVVGVVLSATGDIPSSAEDTTARWAVHNAPYLRPVLDEARRASRPVILVCAPEGPGDGGTAPAGFLVPVLTLLPADTLLPPGWSAYDAVGHAPAWWEAPPIRLQPEQREVVSPRPSPARRKRPVALPPEDAGALFGVTEVMSAAGAAGSGGSAAETAPGVAARSLGARVVASTRLAGQRVYLRRAPDDASVVALIDGLAQAGGRLTLTEAAALVGGHAVRMSGYLAQVGRLLNLDGYAVLEVTDGGKTVTLDQRLLRQQFLGEAG